MQRQINDFKFNAVLGRFNDYFEPKRNVIHERASFHKRNQKEVEHVEEYIRHLYELSVRYGRSLRISKQFGVLCPVNHYSYLRV